MAIRGFAAAGDLKMVFLRRSCNLLEQMNRYVRQRTFGCVRQAKIQISLCIHAL